MRKMRALKILLAVLMGTTLMHAQASRTWVSGVGDDANPCSRTAPCKTFAGAISKTAAGGEIDALDPGGFGALTITKSITLDGGGGQVASVLVAGTNGIVVAAGAGDAVIIRNIRLDGLGPGSGGGLDGIKFISGRSLSIQDCEIFGFQNGINIVSAGGKVFVEGTRATNNSSNGLVVQATANTFVSISRSYFDLNAVGVLAGSFSRVSVRDSVAAGNSGLGFLAQPGAGTAELNIANSSAVNNGTGVQAGNGATNALVRLSGSSIHGNIIGLGIGALGTILSLGNNINTDPGIPSGPVPSNPQ